MIVFTFRTRLRRLSSSRFLCSEVEDLLHIVVGPCVVATGFLSVSVLVFVVGEGSMEQQSWNGTQERMV